MTLSDLIVVPTSQNLHEWRVYDSYALGRFECFRIMEEVKAIGAGFL